MEKIKHMLNPSGPMGLTFKKIWEKKAATAADKAGKGEAMGGMGGIDSGGKASGDKAGGEVGGKAGEKDDLG